MLSSPEFKDGYSTVVIGTDTLLGGNIGSESGRDHFIADQWTSGEPLPEIYDDELSEELRAKGGIDDAKKAGKGLIKKYHLLDLPREVTAIAERETDSASAAVVARTMHSMHLMIQHAYALATGENGPAYEQLYSAVTGFDPQLQDPTETRERLRESLASMGEETTNSRSLVETLQAYRQKRLVPRERFSEEVAKAQKNLLGLTRDNILRVLYQGIPGCGPHLDEIPFNGQRFEFVSGVHFTGSSAYLGGEAEDGKPLLKSLFEYNIDHELTSEEITHLVAHEDMPGHYFNSAVTDLRRRGGKLGFESSVFSMCTPQTVFAEGWAQTALEMAHDKTRDELIEAFGPQWAVLLAVDDLEDLAKHDASILHQRDGVNIPTLQERLSEDYALSPSKVKKISGAWARHPIVGPMYGPAYLQGARVVRKALEKHGTEQVAGVGLHMNGFVDFQRFQDEMTKQAAKI